MTEFGMMKERLKEIYSKYDVFIDPLAKFVLAFLTLCVINGNIGFMKSLSNVVIAFALALVCAFLPSGATVLVISLVMVAHLFSVSMELSVVALLIFCIIYLFYFRFTANGSAWVVLTLLCCMMKIPYVIPIAAGLLSSFFSMIPVIFGVVMYYVIVFAKSYAKQIAGLEEAGDLFENFKTVVAGVLDKEIILIALSFALTIAIVYVIRRLSVDYAWIYAIIAGALTDFVMLLVGNAIFSTHIGFLGILVGLILSVVVGLALNAIFFGVDYSRTERVQFEDDKYYYYVKAVPKYGTATADVKVKKINTQQKKKRVVSEAEDFDDIDLDF